MANKDFPSGMRPVTEGGTGRPRLREYTVLAANTPIYAGAPLKFLNSGTVAMQDTATNTTDNIGVSSGYYPTSTVDIQILVWDDPEQLFVIQDDGTGTPALTWIGNNADFVNPDSGDAFTNQSIAELAGSTPAAGEAANTLRILGKVDRIDNDWDDFVDLIVQYRPGAHFNAIATGV